MDKIKVDIRYGYENPFLSVCIENPKSERFCKVKDMEHFNLWCAGKKALRNKGAYIRVDPKIKENYKCLKQYHGYGNWCGLEFVTKIYTTGFDFEFFQNVTVPENKNGGRYDFNTYRQFPYLLTLRLKVAIKHLIESIAPLCEATVTFTDRHGSSEERILKSYTESCHWPNVKTLEDVAPNMRPYNQGRDSNDRDGKRIHCGEVKYFYGYDGYLHRGIVYHNLNNMWWVIENDTVYSNKACFELFDRTSEPIRKALNPEKKLEKLKAALNQQIKEENFIRCNIIKKEIDKLKIQLL